MKKVISVLVILAGIIVTSFVDFANQKIGGATYAYLPFPVKQTSCGSAFGVASTCTHPMIWWGIILSIIFWILIIWIAYKVDKKKNVGMITE